MRIKTKADRLELRKFYIPTNARELRADDQAAIYVLADPKVRTLHVVAFRGTAGRPEINALYRQEDRATADIAAFSRSVAAQAERQAKRQAERRAWVNPFKVGDLLYTSWGYDQTNVEFYAVTRVSGRRVWVREIARDSEATGRDQGKCWPAMPIQYIGDETRHTAQPSGADDGYVKISSCQHARKLGAGVKYFSTYA